MVNINRKEQGATRRSRNKRRRAAVLVTVHVLILLHILHWKVTGMTLAPLEFNEVMYTLELGIVTVGFLFMLVTVLATLVFGRFFCGWACHILALQDLCAWLLAKMRLPQKQIRSRALFLVAPGAMFYMFIWPQISRILAGRPPPELRVVSDGEGWASFITSDLWRNLPGPAGIVITFAICGFAIVYFFGSRAFCFYACPYGVIFDVADRFAASRVRLVGDCIQCGICTANCSSHVRVHEEVVKFGRVVDPSCMKDLDCIKGCPEEALDFGRAKPSLMESFQPLKRRRYDFSWAEDALIALVFVACFAIFRGLYDLVSFLVTLALSGILAYLAVTSFRLPKKRDVRLRNFRLKKNGVLTADGKVFAFVMVALGIFVVHSAAIRFHEATGRWGLEAAERELASGVRPEMDSLEEARQRLVFVERWGLIHSTELIARLASAHQIAGALGPAENYLRRLLEREPESAPVYYNLGSVLLAQGRPGEAQGFLERAASLDPRYAEVLTGGALP